MHSLKAFALAFLGLSAGLYAACPTSIYIIRDQRTLNDFPDLYPDCEELPGLVAINAAADNLAPLQNIKTISGNVTFDGSIHFKALSGMSSLKEIGGTLRIDDMDSILDLSGLEALETIGGDLIIVDNTDLQDLDGTFMLKEIGGKLEIANNGKLTALFGVTSIRYLGLGPGADLIVEKNPVLQGLQGLQSISEIKGKLTLDRNKALKGVDGLSGLKLVDSAISISYNDALENVDGLRNLETCNDFVYIVSNPALRTINLGALKTVKNRIGIHVNLGLRSIDGANAVRKLDGKLEIKGNTKLDTVRAFHDLAEVGEDVDFSNNGPLPTYGFLRSLKRVNGTFNMFGAAPIGYAGLDSLEYVGKDLLLQSNANSLEGLGSLRYVGRMLFMDSDSLRDVSALKSLDSARALTINYCPRLTSLSGLDNIDAGWLTQVSIIANPKLGDCAVKSICDYLDGNGKIYAGSNTGNCVDTASIHRACHGGSPVRPSQGMNARLHARVHSLQQGLEVRVAPATAGRVEIRVYDARGDMAAFHRMDIDPSIEPEARFSVTRIRRGAYWVEVRVGKERSLMPVVF